MCKKRVCVQKGDDDDFIEKKAPSRVQSLCVWSRKGSSSTRCSTATTMSHSTILCVFCSVSHSVRHNTRV